MSVKSSRIFVQGNSLAASFPPQHHGIDLSLFSRLHGSINPAMEPAVANILAKPDPTRGEATDRVYLRALRPHQWMKNTLMIAATIL